jgi:hypothetical protein
MTNNQDIDMVFFDIGGTLGERHPATGQFLPFPKSVHTRLVHLRSDLCLLLCGDFLDR